jgi:hypothetical protein
METSTMKTPVRQSLSHAYCSADCTSCVWCQLEQDKSVCPQSVLRFIHLQINLSKDMVKTVLDEKFFSQQPKARSGRRLRFGKPQNAQQTVQPVSLSTPSLELANYSIDDDCADCVLCRMSAGIPVDSEEILGFIQSQIQAGIEIAILELTNVSFEVVESTLDATIEQMANKVVEKVELIASTPQNTRLRFGRRDRTKAHDQTRKWSWMSALSGALS